MRPRRYGRQLLPNKALHPTAYSSIRFVRRASSLHSFRFRRRVSLSFCRCICLVETVSFCGLAVDTFGVLADVLRRLFVSAAFLLWRGFWVFAFSALLPWRYFLACAFPALSFSGSVWASRGKHGFSRAAFGFAV